MTNSTFRRRWALSVGSLLISILLLVPVPMAWSSNFIGAEEVSSLTMGTSGGTQGSLIEMGDEGLVITNVAGCIYYQPNGQGGTNTLTGFQGLVAALSDGYNNGHPATATGGITPYDARNISDTNKAYYTVGFALSNQLPNASTAQLYWGAVPLATGSSAQANEMVLRETWQGDANLDGLVNTADYQVWALGFNSNSQGSLTYYNGDFNYDGLVNTADYQSWATSFPANLPTLGPALVQGGPLRPAGQPAVPEPSTLALCLAGVLAFLAFGLRRLRKAKFSSNIFTRQEAQGHRIMKKCRFVYAVIASLAFAAAARADLLDYSLVADQVYTNSSLFTPIAGAISNNGTTVTLPAGTKSGYVVMAILATVNNGASVPISSDGISFAALNIAGTASNMGTGELTNQQVGTNTVGAFVNDGSLGNASGNPGANVYFTGFSQAWWANNWGSPVQAYAKKSTTAPIEWAENFQATGSQGGSSEGNPLVIGKTGPYAASDFGGAYGENGPMFIALYSPPTIPSGARLVSYSNPTTVLSVGANSTATQPGTGAAAYLLGASGINATSATFILGEVDYQFSGAAGFNGTASLQVTPADLRNTDFSYGSDFLADGTQVLSQYLDSTSGSVGVVGTLAPVTVSVGVVPEPTTLALLAAGAAGLLGYAWRKRRRNAVKLGC